MAKALKFFHVRRHQGATMGIEEPPLLHRYRVKLNSDWRQINGLDWGLCFTGTCIDAVAIVEATSRADASRRFNAGQVIKEPVWITKRRREREVTARGVHELVRTIRRIKNHTHATE